MDPNGIPLQPEDPMNQMKLSDVLKGGAIAARMLGHIMKNAEAKNTANMMAMAMSAAAQSNDPKAVMQNMQAPMSDIMSNANELKQKKLSQVLPQSQAPTQVNPAAATDMPAVAPAQIPSSPEDRLRAIRGY